MKISIIRRVILPAACAIGVAVTSPAQAANWLQLQGTEPDGASARARIWGFVQPQWQATSGSDLPVGPYAGRTAVFNQIRPNQDTSDQFQMRRARLGVRGTGFPLDSNVNYFFLVEAGKNGITEIVTDNSVALTDASVTLNHFKKYTRIRVGQFKHPGSEDGLQAIHVHNYVDFATPSDQLLLERIFESDGGPKNAGGNQNTAGNPNRPVGFSAYRDIGIQLFNWFDLGEWKGNPWEASYAFMIGNGNGIDEGDNNSNKDVYLYGSIGQIYKGKGARRDDWKAFAWVQHGERDLKVGAAQIENSYDRTRTGVGLTFRKDKYRLYAEYYWADGMIFNGTDGGAVAGTPINAAPAPPATVPVAAFNMIPNQEADGGYIDLGYKVLPNVEIDYRFSYLDRATNSPDAQEREFWDHTFGVQYFFNKKARAVVNYQIRDGKAPNASSSAGPNQILDELDDLLSAQLLVIF